MFSSILLTKIIPPPHNPRNLPRPRVMQTLARVREYRVTLLQAGAGYGKTAALAEFANAQNVPLIWYQLHPEDADPLVFLLHLSHACAYALPKISGLPTTALEAWDGTQGTLAWRTALDQIINALSLHLQTATVLVVDDVHFALNGETANLLNHLVNHAPPHLHLFLSGRPPLELPALSRLRAQGDVQTLDQHSLAFDEQEIHALFQEQYHIQLTPAEVRALKAYSEGWAIALQLIWQSLRNATIESDSTRAPRDHLARWQGYSREALFDLLAHEILEKQSDELRQFLQITATLRHLTPEACHALCNPQLSPNHSLNDSKRLLAYLKKQDLFVSETAEGGLRYHPIFHEFLRQQSTPAQQHAAHQYAARYFLTQNDLESALYHLLEAQNWVEAAQVLANYAPVLLAHGRLDTLSAYLDVLPPETLSQNPVLLFTLGELARLHSRFEAALGWYKQAETLWRNRAQPDGVARALRGQARVYLDTVNPVAAQRLLEEALRLHDGFEDRESQVRLYELLAENKLNAGRAQEAEQLRARAEELRLQGPTNEQLLYRVWLRTGKLQQAQAGLQALAESEKREPVQTPRAHRETLLLLSLIHAFMGLPESAYQAALEGTRRGPELKSPYITAIGHMRQGHALMLLNNYTAARTNFEINIELSRTLNVPRLLVESNWGLCRAYGYQNDLAQAQKHAEQALEIATQAGDEWIASLTRLTFGASLSLARDYPVAETWLHRARTGFEECADTFGSAAARLWLAHISLRQKQPARLERYLTEALSLCRQHQYNFLLTRASLIGAPDERLFVPLLLYARQNGCEAGYATQLLETLGLAHITLHPGYQLRVQTLGAFNVWRGQELIPANGWRREKARQLFQILLTYRHTSLDRDQICEFLWAESDPQTAQRNFKVTLNALYHVLEPERDPGSESAFIVRDETLYRLRPEADLWLDADVFTRELAQPQISTASLMSALALYHGDYLPGARYEAWSAEERERLAARFLENADRLAGLLLEAGEYPQAIEICQRILAQDNCWERAYRYLMRAYSYLGNRGQIARVYQRCVKTLRTELDVSPSAETERLYAQLSAA